MKSVVFTGVGKADVATVPDPELRGAGDAILRVTATAICGSDLHIYRGEWGDPAGQRPGHEFIGEVVEVGSEVRGFGVGDRVIASGGVGCGSCEPCSQSLSALCAAGPTVVGIPQFADWPGGQAEYVAVPHADAALLPLPEAATPERALLLTDNLATGWLGAVRSRVQEGDAAAVVGFGPVGMCAAMSLRALGAWQVFVLDPIASRREFAASLGYNALDSTDQSVAQVVELTGGGAPTVVETAGREAAVRAAFGVAHATGVVSSISVPSEAYSVEPPALAAPTQRYVPTMASPQRAWPQLLPRLDNPAFARLDEIFSHQLPLDAAGEAYDLFSNRPDECRKVRLTL